MRLDVLLALVVGLIYVVAQLLLLRPPALSDQLDYFSSAAALPDVSPNHRHLRIGLLFPVRVAIWLFDYSEAAYYALPILGGTVLAVSTFFLGRYLYGRVVGVVGGGLTLLNPYVLWDSTHLLPDVPAAACLVVAVVMLVRAGQRNAVDGVRAAGTVTFAAAGFLLGWSYLIREYTVIFFLLVPLVFALYRVPWRRLVPVSIGALSALAIELAWGAFVYGEPLARISRVVSPRQTDRPFATEPLDVASVLVDQLLGRSGGVLWVALIVLLLLGPVIARLAGRPAQGPLLLLAWGGGMWLVLTSIGLLPMLLGEDRVLLRLQKIRYWYPVFPAIVVGGLGAIDLGVRRLVRATSLQALLAAVVVASVALVAGYQGVTSITHSGAWVRNGNDDYLELRRFLRDQGEGWDVMWVTEGSGRASGRVVPMYTRTAFGRPIWDGELRALSKGSDFRPAIDLDSGMVVVQPASIRYAVRRGEPLPPYLIRPPDDWAPVLTSSSGSLALFAVDGADTSREVLITDEVPDWTVWGRGDTDPGEASTVATGSGLAVAVPAEARVFVTDGYGPHLRAAEGGGLVRMQYGLLRGQLSLVVEGEGTVDIECFFFAADGTRYRAPAVWTQPPPGGGDVGFTCRPPEEARAVGELDVRLGVAVTGPSRIEVGAVSLERWSPAVLR